MKPLRKAKKPSPRSDDEPPMPVLDKPPTERTPKEVREAIENDAVLERRGEYSR
jgi:hypothetical protein